MTACLGRRVAELADGRLVGSELERALAHVSVCASCRDALEIQRSMKARLRGSNGPAPSDTFIARLSKVPDSPVRTDPSVAVAKSRARHRRRIAVAGASTMVVAFAIVGGASTLAQTATSIPVVVPNLAAFSAEHVSVSGSLPEGGSPRARNVDPPGTRLQSAGVSVSYDQTDLRSPEGLQPP